jgi:ribosomal protein S18 acetylase RimI-like enzyme
MASAWSAWTLCTGTDATDPVCARIRALLGAFFYQHAAFGNGQPVAARDDYTVCWIEDDKRRVCVAALLIDEPKAGTRIWNLVVDREKRRQGWAQKLLKALRTHTHTRAHTHAAAAAPLRLWVLETNEPARALYTRLGWREVGRGIVGGKRAIDMDWPAPAY